MGCKFLSRIPQRYVVVFFCFLSVAVIFQLRVSFNVVINQMVKKKKKASFRKECSTGIKNKTKKSSPSSKQKLAWTENEQTLVKSAFYIGYLFTHIVAACLVDTFGGKSFIAASIIISIVFTIVIPVVAEVGGLKPVIFCRICVGLGQGLHFPAMSTLLAQWIPIKERSFLGSFAMSGAPFGSMLGTILTTVMTTWFRDWTISYYLLSFLSFIMLGFFLCFIYSYPEHCPFITKEEKDFLDREIPERCNARIPFFDILTDASVWAQAIGQVGHSWTWFTFNTDMAKYVMDIFDFSFNDLGIIGSLPNLSQTLSTWAWGLLADYVYRKKYMKMITIRRWSTVIGMIFPGIMGLMIALSRCNLNLVISFLILSLLTKGPYYSGVKCNHWDTSRNYAGVVNAIVNGLGTIGGIATPFVDKALTKNHTSKEWRIVFYIANVLNVITTLIYYFFTTGKRRKWDMPLSNEKIHFDSRKLLHTFKNPNK